MIIAVNGNQHEIDVTSSFKVTWNQAIKYVRTMNGNIFVSDRGATSDKWDSSFTVIGDWDILEALADDIRAENGQITLLCDKEEIFGSGFDYTQTFECNLTNDSVLYPVRDIKTSTMTLNVRTFREMIIDSGVTPATFNPNYQYDVKRSFNKNRTAWDAIDSNSATSDYGVTTLNKDHFSNKAVEGAEISFEVCNDTLAGLLKTMQDNRVYTPTWTTAHLNLFIGTNSVPVYITKFSYKKTDVNMWMIDMTIARGV